MLKRNKSSNICESCKTQFFCDELIGFFHSLNCHELRPKLRQALLEDSKKSQLKQIEEKQRLRQIEQDEENMWLEIQRRTQNDQLIREQMEKDIRKERNACAVKYLNWLQANKKDGKESKRQENEEQKHLNALNLADMKRLDAQKRADEVEKQRNFARDCKVCNWRRC